MSGNRSPQQTVRPADPTAEGDAPAERFAWRRRIRANPLVNTAYRCGIAVVGAAIVVGGIILLPLPGPGWVIIFAGIGVWATEFAWAKRLLRFAQQKVAAWGRWMQRQPWWMQGLVTLGIVVLVLLVFWGLFAIGGVPSFFPGWATDLLGHMPGLG
ncbi:TIGR02611 family protein [Leekyejoonella antrihumi]|uniref:TIGR02611 family protein n=1 Tax=Leekyejoonella antrihumi TaxID=1660198 RepID=A0A563E0Q1_9MICO|nr:TIGR02611 family protein [Leekyejoonella antrihumi]TWP35803.1 TIGR02611 family protein [Leekyejoonella antrihumi]